MRNFKKSAFTLAEVLITLGIIGVVAAITLPTFIQNYQKRITVNKLKHTYSIINQAIKLSEVQNGFANDWNNVSDIGIDNWLNKYFLPYVKYISINSQNNNRYIKLSNGVILKFIPDQTQLQTWVYLDGNINKPRSGRNCFMFFIGYPPENSKDRVFKDNKSAVIPYDYVSCVVSDFSKKREYITQYSCNKNNKFGCSALILLDNWQIKDDYPW